MCGRWIFCVIAAATPIFAADSTAIIRQREDELARALNAKDKAVLSTLVDKDCHIGWTLESVASSDRTEDDRDHWIDDLMRLQIVEYDAAILKISVDRETASVLLDETWTIQSSHGRQIVKHLTTMDGWLRSQGTWKLTLRDSH